METQSFNKMSIESFKEVVNVFFNKILLHEGFDFDTEIDMHTKNKNQMVSDVMDLCHGFIEIFNNSVRATNSETIDFSNPSDFEFVSKYIFKNKERTEFINSLNMFYHFWISGQNLSNLIAATIRNCIIWTNKSSNPGYVYILFLILFQSSLVCIDMSFSFKKNEYEEKLYNSILKIKKNHSLLTDEVLDKLTKKGVKLFKKLINVKHIGE